MSFIKDWLDSYRLNRSWDLQERQVAREKKEYFSKVKRQVLEAGDDPVDLMKAGAFIDSDWNDDEYNEAYLKLVELFPENPIYQLRLGNSILRYGTGPERCGCDDLPAEKRELAFACLHRAETLDSRSKEIVMALATHYYDWHQTEEQEREMKSDLLEKVIHYHLRLLEFEPEHKASLQILGEELHKVGDIEGGLKYLSEFERLSTPSPELWRSLSSSYGEANQPQKSLEFAMRWQASEGESFAHWDSVSYAYEQVGEIDKAVEAMNKTNGSAGFNLFRAGEIYLRAKRFQEALNSFAAAGPKLEIEDRVFVGSNCYKQALALNALERRNEGVAILEANIAARPDQTDPVRYLASFYFETGDYANALKVGLRAEEMNSLDGGVQNLLQHCREKLAENSS